MKIKNYIKETIAIILYIFRQAIYYLNPSNGYFLVGNLDLFYLYAPWYVIKNIKNNKKMLKIFIFATILFFYMLLQFSIIKDYDIKKALINTLKILVCYIVFLYVKENFQMYSVNKMIKIFMISITVLFVFSLIFQNGMLWRHGDTINKYDLIRLKLLYTEPSELGFHSMTFLIVIIGKTINKKMNLKFSLISIIILSAIIILAKPMASILIGLIAISYLIFHDWIHNNTKIKNFIYFGILIFSIIMVMFSITERNSLYLRLKDITNGKDSSNNYRVIIPYKVVKQMIIDTKGIGVGFGNAELDTNVTRYWLLGLRREGIINSYLNLIGESGIFGIILVLYIIYELLKNSIKQKNNIKLALTIFIILYQFCGSHFTNPICWIIYGIIMNSEIKTEEDNNINKNKEEL